MNASFGKQVKVSAGCSSRNLALGHCGKMPEIVALTTGTVTNHAVATFGTSSLQDAASAWQRVVPIPAQLNGGEAKNQGQGANPKRGHGSIAITRARGPTGLK